MHGKCKGKPSRIINALLIAFLTYGLAACGGGSSDGDTQLLGGGFSQGEVIPIEFGSGGTANIQFGELSGDEEFALILFSANNNQGIFDIKLTSASESLSAKEIGLPPLTNLNEDSANDPTAEFHEMLRDEESYLLDLEPYDPDLHDSGKALSNPEQNFDTVSKIPCADGRGVYYKVLISLSNTDDYDLACAIEKRVTDNVIYYVDEQAQFVLPDSVLNAMIEDFESKLTLEQNIIGEETDLDGNGRFFVFFTPAINRLGFDAGGFITGYFYGGDLFPESSIPSSNQGEILYISVPDPQGQWGVPLEIDFWASNIGPTVLPHEYQHMISFRHKVLFHEIGAEKTWANEGLSHLLEDLDPHNKLSKVSEENPSRVGVFLSAPESSAFTSGSSLGQRGGAYLFFRYLCEQADLSRYPGVSNCDELLRELIHSPGKGVLNIEEVTGWPFKNLLLDFYAAVQLSNTGVTDDLRYNFQGICLTCKQDDNRGTILNGVNEKPLLGVPALGSVSSPGGLFYNLLGKTIINAGQTIHLETPAGMIPGGAVIRLR